nr:hypothetical protein [Tanacetum cinerariifolium]
MYGHYDYSSHHNVGGSSSQPNVGGSSSPVRHFSLDDEDFTQMYSPQFSDSFRQEQSSVEEMVEIQTPKEETALCKGWICIFEDSVKGNARKERGFWIEILKVAEKFYYLFKRGRMARTRDTSQAALVRSTRRTREKEGSIGYHGRR